MRPQISMGLAVTIFAVMLTGCNLAPKYSRPTLPAPAAYKEAVTNASEVTNVWKVAQPSDGIMRGQWWEIFHDAQLSALEEQVNVSNQNVAAALASFLSARALVKEARSQLFPTVATAPATTRSRQPLLGAQLGGPSRTPATFTSYNLPLEASWQLDLWGRLRNTVKANSSEAQASAADLQNVRLAAQAEVAADYFSLRSQDALKQLFAETVKAYQESLDLTKARYETGIASDEDMAQAETQLRTAQAQATNVGVLRAQLEHAIAMLIGRPAAAFSIPDEPLKSSPPAIPAGLPSDLLERRPDIAAAERRVAEANAQIGVARAAYFPTVTLSASGGYESTSISSLLSWPSRVWSIGAALSETLFDAGLRKAAVQQSRATYEGTVARYRQTALTAFQQVEDNLSTLRILAVQQAQQEEAVRSSERYLALATDRYKLGIDAFLNVITAQTTLLGNRQTLVNLHAQQMTASVQLIEALGGGWEATMLPSSKQLLTGAATASIRPPSR